MAVARSRKWLITINNPADHGFDHDRIKAAVLDLPGILYWCMCDEQGDECETLHTLIWALSVPNVPIIILLRSHRNTQSSSPPVKA